LFQENAMKRFHSVLLAAVVFAGAATPSYADDNRYDAKVLVADIPPAPHIDAHLVNPWGVAFNPNGFVWVADNGTGFSTLYDGLGNPAPQANPLIVAIPAAPGADHGTPTGIVFNGGGGFAVTANGKTGNSAFIFATEDGLIAGWSPAVDLTHAIQAYPKAGAPASGAVYKGLAIATSASGNTLYAADFVGGKIDVFNSTFTKIAL